MESGRKVAFFDFDGTLIAGDSLWPFLCGTAGTFKTIQALAAAVAVNKLAGAAPDNRTGIKERLLRTLLKDRPIGSFDLALAKLKNWVRYTPTLEKLHDHHKAGHTIVIATGSLDLYMPTLLENIPHDALLCTEIETRDGLVTGRMAHGNCVRTTKAERVAAYLRETGPFDESWAYGNLPHDLPMMMLTQHRIIV